MPKKKQQVEKCEGPDFALKSRVRILRHPLWANHVGTVESVHNHRHLLRVEKNGVQFFAEVCGVELRLEGNE